jgi:hypothetical protein
MNPYELCKLTQFVRNTYNHDEDCIEGFRLHAELHRLSHLTAPERHDRTMREIVGDSQYAPPHFDAPFPTSHTSWHHEPIPHARIVWESRGPGLPTPGPSSAFSMEQWMRYILYHGQPGCMNPFIGVAFNHVFHVHYHSIFGHLLFHALAPVSSTARAVFTCHFTCLIVVPHCYQELVQDWVGINGQPEDFPDPRPTITLSRMDWMHPDVHTMTINNITHLMIDNHIPISWANHAYTYSLHFIDHYMTGSPEVCDLYEAVDDLRLLNLSIWGIPEAITEWDRWQVPTSEDLDRLQHILTAEEHKGIYCKDDSSDWLLAGEDPHCKQLRC